MPCPLEVTFRALQTVNVINFALFMIRFSLTGLSAKNAPRHIVSNLLIPDPGAMTCTKATEENRWPERNWFNYRSQLASYLKGCRFLDSLDRRITSAVHCISNVKWGKGGLLHPSNLHRLFQNRFLSKTLSHSHFVYSHQRT